MSTSVFNRRWAVLLLEALSRHGVRHVCIAPGSRSTPLTLAAAANRSFICHTHFDERGLGHLALGLAKAAREPVAVIVTSGTAAANLYPSLIEAGLTGERLVFLTADRPPELIDCGANQAIRQHGLYASHPTLHIDLPRPTPDIPASWLASAVDSAMARLRHGALHINCPFAEPLYGGDEQGYADWSAALGDWWQDNRPWLREEDAHLAHSQADWFFWRQKRGVVVAGRMSTEAGAKLAEWAAMLGWPLIGDVQSQTGQPLPCADLWLAQPQAQRILQDAQLVLQFGGSLTGKRLLQWQERCRPEEYWLIDALPGRLDPAQHRGRRIRAEVAQWLALHPAQPRAPWAGELARLADDALDAASAHLVNRFGEAQLAHRLPELLPENGQLFLGNSLVVRLVDALTQLPAGYPVYGNRGASGIDGLISTAAGVQRATARPTLAVVGDLSALYDINALALLRQCSAPTVLLVVNNNGGQIFSLLPTPEADRQRFYCMPQDVEFSHAAAMFRLNYARPENWGQLQQAVEQGWRHGGATLIELQVPPGDGAACLQHLVQQMAVQ
ncbi:2-succinyl-5-enolpyruvyl-6-hydroxy-3-cyclohexene-1-carboxylate synthase [Serratia entomophila]|uniref:2-succinyl-5-enolpyruvyl-6-hydroxy-3- cyclohexene-1-carboxylic-acid synthase n=1 Tax=Serratia entomophila TaxID=42906 RepID=UPI00217A332A|nr:2-succinyl-5-enolpyruvyl-6-hydroxy-3-cyclohexene-1-carboxylic-acid synthase [Serratia entomophila]CAI1497368.1 2-succinyl-5-enolpyruvyl-6-hydroxy-3-cyclohexene-1-carboxylate synthase [Serratia entomophila]CAI1502590.1 2-succinyl-5-enolpyruvyl-6-hydroxy-3-cyclohexene-1-carboxylate synthase [Serratia entomophila]CAI1544708.1 2-succinyl-5-enolpyruvyl-6-hydroxy-3-cyclohexene-1-carboxylate synthase [Serratia entomophila]CAI2922556.1 2-succinyl-5-enolpyruvyl-6-hydroxy-3-cyclohexene-1-carboxylate s